MCSIVNYLNDNSISASAFLEIVTILLSAVALWTKCRFPPPLTSRISPNSAGVKTMLTIYSNLYEIFYELHCRSVRDL